jgi:NAD(P)-dependent dehydrogenase (short-subunit alcohol dehydrogenase family)
VAKLEGKVAVVSGGAGGIGSCIVQLFVQEGAAVVIADVLKEAGEQLAASLQTAGGRAVFQQTDVTHAAQVQAAIQRGMELYGRLDVLVNCAGWIRVEMAVRATEADFDRTIATHVKGTWLMCRSALPHMMAAGRGSIVNISSMQAYGAIPGRVAYEAAKGGISAMTRELALEYGPAGIRVNAVCPGVIMTDRNQGRHAALPEEERRLRVESYPLRRLGTPGDVAHAVLFLASDDASWVTGTDLLVDGGMSIQLAEAIMYPPFRRLWREVVPTA